MLTIQTDRNRISNHFKSTVRITSDEEVYAYEARATRLGEPYGRGIGYDLLSDDTDASNGVVTLASPLTELTFDIESSELLSDGDYRISIYVMNADGVWNDTCQLYTSSGEAVKDSDGRNVLVKREDGTQMSYTSAYSGKDMDDFITEVLYE